MVRSAHTLFMCFVNSDLWHLQHKLIGFYNRDEKCLQRGTDWGFKSSGLRSVFKRLSKIKSMHALTQHTLTTVLIPSHDEHEQMNLVKQNSTICTRNL
jgi:hypothetical protein